MPSARLVRLLRAPRTRIALIGALLFAAVLPTGSALGSQVKPPKFVAIVPKSGTPNIQDGQVNAIAQVGTKVIVGGTFTQVENASDSTTVLTRNYILAFDKASGVVDTAFVPVLDGEVDSLLPGKVANTVYVAGKFSTVNGVAHKGIIMLNTLTGTTVTTFKPPAIDSAVLDVKFAGSHLLIAGTFTMVKKSAHAGIASLNPSTGALDPFVNIQLAGHHNFTGTGAESGVGGNVIAVAPDGTKAVVIGNFKTADGQDRDQVFMMDLTGTTAAVADWETDKFKPACFSWAFDNWVRNVAFAPDSSYFVIVATGGPNSGTVCDSATRWESGATGTGVTPTWTTLSGGDTLLSVAITPQVVYVGGHVRWLNNSFGADSPGPGAVGRASIAALDPLTGLPLTWNPGRNPRGFGVTTMLSVSDGLWLGYDTDYLGNSQYLRQRIGFFPNTGGATIAPTTVPALPGHVYQAGEPGTSNVLYRVNAGGPALLASDGGPQWAADQSDPSPYRNSGSNTASFGQVGSMDATVPPGTPVGIFTDERWDPSGGPEMDWDFPVTAGKQVEVRLYMSNRYSGTSQPGQRLFNVSIDGTQVLTNWDNVAQAGDNTGTMRAFDVTSPGTVDITFTHVVENPNIDGIEIIDLGATPAPPTDNISARGFDGTTAGAAAPLVNADSTDWHDVRGAFMANGTLYFGMSDGNLYSRSFDGTTFGTATLVDPYHDHDGVAPNWDTVQTGSGQTFAGVPSNFYGEIGQVTGMTFANGKLYYSLFGKDGLYWRWFTPQSGVVGADEFTVAGASGFLNVGGMFSANDQLYLVDTTTGNLTAQGFTGGVPAGSPAVVSGPGADGIDWRASATFLGP